MTRQGKIFCKVYSEILAHVPAAEQEKQYWRFLTTSTLTGETSLPSHPFGDLAKLYSGKI